VASVDAAPLERLEVLVAVDVEGADVGCATDEVDLDIDGWSVGGVVGFDAVVAVGWFAFAAVETDEADVAGFEEPVEVHTA
jgi:hypothetical protein